MANVAAGVHAGKDKDDNDRRMTTFRHAMQVDVKKASELQSAPKGVDADTEIPTIGIALGDAVTDEAHLIYSDTQINGLLLEILATIHFLVKSPDLIKLVEIIKVEVGKL